MEEPFNTDRFALGPLCKRGHDWQESGQSLRYQSTRQCVACMKGWATDYNPTYYETHGDQIRARKRAYHHANRETILPKLAAYARSEAGRAAQRRFRQTHQEQVHQHCRDWRAVNREHVSAYNRVYDQAHQEYTRERRQRYQRENAEAIAERGRQYRQQHRELLLEKDRAYRHTPIGKLRRKLAQRRRDARKRKSVVIPYTPEELYARFGLFDHACAYCEATSDLTLEHVIPISKGGADQLSNIVPACKTCNFSKHQRDMEPWYRKQPSFDETRLHRIVAYTRAKRELWFVEEGNSET